MGRLNDDRIPSLERIPNAEFEIAANANKSRVAKCGGAICDLVMSFRDPADKSETFDIVASRRSCRAGAKQVGRIRRYALNRIAM